MKRDDLSWGQRSVTTSIDGSAKRDDLRWGQRRPLQRGQRSITTSVEGSAKRDDLRRGQRDVTTFRGPAGRDDLSGGQAFGVAREHGRLADVVEAQVEHCDALHADAAAGVRRRPVAERLDVRADLLHLCNRRACGVIVVVVVARTPSADGRRDRRRATRNASGDDRRENGEIGQKV